MSELRALEEKMDQYDQDKKHLKFLLANTIDRADGAERLARKLQSEIDSHKVDSERRDKLGTAYELYLAGWRDGHNCPLAVITPSILESDWEIYQLDRARTQGPATEPPTP